MISRPLATTRRGFLRLASAGAAGCALPARAASRGEGEFTLVIVNDLHYRDARCGEWLRRVVADVAALRPRPAFVMLAGDLSEDGTGEQIVAVRRVFAELAPIPVRALIGNHDYTLEGDRTAFERAWGPQLNYRFDHGGCQFVALDSTQGHSVYRTRIPASTLEWVDSALPGLSRERPTILLTHFPLGRNWLRPLNAHGLLDRFQDHHLMATFSGHWHGITERQEGAIHLSTSRCCSWWRENHDGSDEKGYTIAQVTSRRSATGLDWTIDHRFRPVAV